MDVHLGGPVTSQAEIRAMCIQAKGHQGLLETARSWEEIGTDSPSQPSMGTNLENTWTSENPVQEGTEGRGREPGQETIVASQKR